METQSELIERKIQATRGAAIAFIAERFRDELEARLEKLEGPCEHDGQVVIPEKGVREAAFDAFSADLPPTDVRSAEVVTPAIVFVDVICPLCKGTARVVATLAAELRVGGGDSELHIKAKASKSAHSCGQQTMIDVPEEEKVDAEKEAALEAVEDILEEPPVVSPKRSRKPKIAPVAEEVCPFPGCTFAADHVGAHSPTMAEDLPPDAGDDDPAQPWNAGGAN